MPSSSKPLASAWLRFPHFLYLLPFFFVFHAYAQNPQAITATDVWALVCEYLLAAGLLFAVGLFLFRNRNKAAVFSFGLMALHFFFGAVHDLLKKAGPLSFFAKYSVLLPLLLVLVLLFLFFLKRTTKRFLQTAIYLNLLFAVLLLLDLPVLFQKEEPAKLQSLKPCPSCRKPDVWFIVADGYADSLSLAQAFSFNNTAFLSELRKRKFHIVDSSRSNYNFTQYSVASVFKMDYLPGIKGVNSNRNDINACYGTVNQNELLHFFQLSGYRVKNYSLFNVANQPAIVEYKFVPMGKNLIAAQTLLQRIYRDLDYHLVTTLKLQPAIERVIYYSRDNNAKIERLLLKEARDSSAQPRFVFAHFEMPHYPYYFDRNGRARPLDFFSAGNESNTGAYVEYLQYANGVYLRLLDEIVQHARQPPVIVFMSDHGFREFGGDTTGTTRFHFMNFNSVLLPSGDYSRFYRGLSCVNQFRAVMNTEFDQHLPYRKDSMIFIAD